jgi:pyruvate/2-oxoglutarate dehydrogenase complex dihydrolipoamide acyltransferase (E2) component
MNKILEVIKTPQESVNDDSVVIIKVFVKNGEKINDGALLAEIETSKANIEIHCEKAGFVNCLCEENQEVLIGETLFEIYSESLDNKKTVINKNPPIKNKSDNKKGFSKNFNTKFSKAAENLISKNKVNKDVFKNLEFVSIHEVNNYLKPSKVDKIKDTSIQDELLTIDKDLISDEENLGKKKLNEIKYLSHVNSTGLVSRLTIFINCNLDNIVENQNFISSTPLPLISYEVSRLLLKYPNLNSFFFSGNKISHKNINIGIAYDNGINGLKVASIYNTDSLDLNTIEENISELSIKYNDNKLSIKEISSSSFTITDLFSSGISNFHPLVNINNSVILGICGLNNGGFNLEVSFDHRISSGLEVSKFLNDLKYRLEARYCGDEKNKVSSNITNCNTCLRDLDDDLDGDVKFIKIINSEQESVICSICLSGW